MDTEIAISPGSMQFNKAKATMVGWFWVLRRVDLLPVVTPSLKHLALIMQEFGPDSREFAIAVNAWQLEEGLKPDNKLGFGTWARMKLHMANNHSGFTIRVAGAPLKMPGFGCQGPWWSKFVKPGAEIHREVVVRFMPGWSITSRFAQLSNNGQASHFLASEVAGSLYVYQTVDLADSTTNHPSQVVLEVCGAVSNGIQDNVGAFAEAVRGIVNL